VRRRHHPKHDKIGSALETIPAWRQPSGSLQASPPGAWRRPERRNAMRTLAQSAYLESEFGTLSELPSAGTPLENPYVYDASARELKAMASQGLVKIVEERRLDVGPEGLISHLTFERLR